jgi:HAD superfamily hydrolase (TIGR01509 family)
MKTILVDAVNTLIVRTESGEYSVDTELLELLTQYVNPKIVLTNADDSQIEIFGLTRLPYPVFTMKHNPDKPDPLYFEMLLSTYNLTATDVVYFEHNPAAILSAQSVGIATQQYDSSSRDYNALKVFLDSSILTTV